MRPAVVPAVVVVAEIAVLVPAAVVSVWIVVVAVVGDLLLSSSETSFCFSPL